MLYKYHWSLWLTIGVSIFIMALVTAPVSLRAHWSRKLDEFLLMLEDKIKELEEEEE